jgi:hypothetical protein
MSDTSEVKLWGKIKLNRLSEIVNLSALKTARSLIAEQPLLPLFSSSVQSQHLSSKSEFDHSMHSKK